MRPTEGQRNIVKVQKKKDNPTAHDRRENGRETERDRNRKIERDREAKMC